MTVQKGNTKVKGIFVVFAFPLLYILLRQQTNVSLRKIWDHENGKLCVAYKHIYKYNKWDGNDVETRPETLSVNVFFFEGKETF